ncbi:hypothetical protein [Nostoc sp. 106C]|uniref:hypothetical protein n=1 Tax=Nostoc sp. 106C TaxID=1932667 RepID=UPI000A38DD04|nr:hypothetical protein [Nostoc sp. 106C]OUL28783.1 hypothetical protein BV375_16835 [Nostoc sp. 106C]
MQIKDYPLKSSPVGSDLLLLQDSSDNSYESAPISSILSLVPTGTNLKYIQLLDSRTSGTAGGSFTSGSWQPRTVNTVATDQTSQVTLSSNTFVLPAGTYWLDCKAAFYLGNATKLRLQNTTDNTTILLGLSAWGFNSSFDSINFLSGCFTIGSSKNLQIQYRVSGTNIQSPNLGDAVSFGVNEIYLIADLLKFS